MDRMSADKKNNLLKPLIEHTYPGKLVPLHM